MIQVSKFDKLSKLELMEKVKLLETRLFEGRGNEKTPEQMFQDEDIFPII